MKPVARELSDHHEAAWGWAQACCSWDADEAQEVLQHCYERVLDGRARFAGRSSLRTWWFGVIRRVAAERRRRAGVRRVLFGRFLGEARHVEDRPGPLHGLERSETSRQLVEALQELSTRQREVLHLVFYGDLTIEEASQTLGIGLGSARVHYARGKRRLRVLLEESDVDPARRAS